MTQQFNLNKKSKREIFKSGKWSNDEQSLFEQGLNFYGKDWRKIQRYVKTRSLLQVRSHAQKYFLMVEKIETIKPNVGTRTSNRSENIISQIFEKIEDQKQEENLKTKVELQNTSNFEILDVISTPSNSIPQNTVHQKVICQNNNHFENSLIEWTPILPSNTESFSNIGITCQIQNPFPQFVPYYNMIPHQLQMLTPWGMVSIFNWKK